MIVVDASALIRVLLRIDPYDDIADIIFVPGQIVHAPHLLDAEVAQVLRRYSAAGRLDDARGFATLEAVRAMAIVRHSHGTLLARVWALRHNFTAYDSLYVALSESLDAPLLTRDERLRAATRQFTGVELV